MATDNVATANSSVYSSAFKSILSNFVFDLTRKWSLEFYKDNKGYVIVPVEILLEDTKGIADETQ